MKLFRIRLIVAAMCVLLVTVVARSQDATTPAAPPQHGHGYGHGFGMGHGREYFAKYLNLSDAQRTQMKDILAKERPGLKPLFQQLHQTQQQLKQYEQGTYDEAKVRALAASQTQVMAELTVQETRIHSELFQVLTTDQQAKMKEVQANREARMQRHMQQAAPATPPEQ